ncbi:SDR family oxidoreductase [Pseudonocardia sp. ICBG1034]|uniref:1-hydroxy-2-glutathionyl-2-methyl-3-butene dehydrogenase n=1 Tax=unclassified Pseudonocardia TaxID=2619320 RepID=UPI00136E2F5D|nr:MULTISPECIES: SDR family oxidoreductase [unclassified Pseudonocardia]MYW71940.1 SDR family NAD(P)-dependent oxidoreductase [Pseudonocardia sp. SID8383]
MATKLIIGADRGIANAMSRLLHDRGDDVVAACFGDGADLAGLGIAVEQGVDVTSDEAVSGLAKRLEQQGRRLEWLVNVAGIMHLDTLETVDYDDVRKQFEINTLGPLRVVRELRGLIDDGAKVGVLTSRIGSLEENGSGGDYAYRISKAAANMVTLNLHHDLKQRGIAVQALHPGMVLTNLLDVVDPELMSKYASAYSPPDKAAQQLVDVLDALTVETAGKFQHANGEILPW